MTLKDKAERIAADLADPFEFDPFTVVLILSILVKLVELYMVCKSAAGAVAALADPGWWAEWLMDRTIRKQVRNTPLEGRESEIKAAILKSGRETTVSEMAGFYAEVKERG